MDRIGPRIYDPKITSTELDAILYRVYLSTTDMINGRTQYA